MKIVIIFGSPNNKGKTKQFLNKILESFKFNFEYYYLYEMNILPCIDCKFCYKNKGCFIKNDDMNILYEAVLKADILIVSSPLHFGNLSSKIITFLSRFQTFWAAKFLRKDLNEIIIKKTKAFLVLTSGTSWPNLTLIPEAQIKFLFNLLKIDNFGTVCADKTDIKLIIENKNAIEKGKKIIKWMLEDLNILNTEHK